MTLLDQPGPAPTDHDAPSTGPAPDRRRTTAAEDLGFLFFGLWTLFGLALDGWAHRNRPGLETFFTPWHAVFYSGFVGGVAWLAWLVVRGRAQAPTLWAAVPRGYTLALGGLAAFAVGGVGDGFWHTVFGVETGIDALLSPTHLLMLVGMLAGITAPLRAAWHDPIPPAGSAAPLTLGRFLPPLLSVSIATTSVAFFFLYANGFNNWPMTDPLQGNGQSQANAGLGVLSIIVSTVILLTPVMVLLQRWVPPAGAFTVLYGLVGLFMAALDGYRFWWQIVPAVAGGLVADAVVATTLRNPRALPPGSAGSGTAGSGTADHSTEPGTGPYLSRRTVRRTALACGLAVPVAMWSVSTVAIHLAWEVRWPPELWAGAIVMAALAGAGLAGLTHPAQTAPPGAVPRHHR